MIIINLNSSSGGSTNGMMGQSGSSEAEKRMDEIVKGTKLEYTEITVMGSSIIIDEIMEANNASMAILLPLAFTLVIQPSCLRFCDNMGLWFWICIGLYFQPYDYGCTYLDCRSGDRLWNTYYNEIS